MGLGHVLLASLGEPAVGGFLAQILLLGGDDEIALLQELAPGDVARDVGGLEHHLAPVEFGASFREIGGEAKALADIEEDLEIGPALAERLDAFVLQRDHAMIELTFIVVAVAAGRRPFADVPALEIGAGGQDDIREGNLALVPDRLVDDELQAV